ncbi:hypothetical protein N9E56_02725 [Flavobacteriaceae bacterium]|nr:hypothetical protein [Flavobacteriaceae bacterium]
MKTTKTGLHIETKGNTIEVYTPKELKELNEMIAQNKKAKFNFAVAFFITIVFIAGYIFGSI